jgi:hypothetical protein
MTSISRRAFFAALGAAVAVAFGAVAVSAGFKSWIMKQLEEEFGSDVAGTADASAFTDDFMAYLAATDPSHYWRRRVYFRLKPRFVDRDLVSEESALRTQVINLFLLSTNYVLAKERGRDFHYIALCDPYLHPCSNQLNSLHLGEPVPRPEGTARRGHRASAHG